MIPAQYPGICANCEQPIRIGQMIESEEGEWVHVECPADKVETVCPSCWTIHAGSCL